MKIMKKCVFKYRHCLLVKPLSFYLILGLQQGVDLFTPSNQSDGAGETAISPMDSDALGFVTGLADMAKSADRAFTITYQKEVDYSMIQHSLVLLAKDQKTYNVWFDGINILLGNNLLDQKSKRKSESKFEKELEDILTIDLRLSLLNPNDTFDFKAIPTAPPPPSNYNFTNFKICPETRRIVENEA